MPIILQYKIEVILCKFSMTACQFLVCWHNIPLTSYCLQFYFSDEASDNNVGYLARVLHNIDMIQYTINTLCFNSYIHVLFGEGLYLIFILQDSMNMSMNSTMGGVSFSQSSSKPPGYLLLLHIMNEGNFFKTVTLLGLQLFTIC